MVFRHFSSIFNEINKIRQSNTFVDTKLVFCDGSLLVHSHVLETGGQWWSKCRDAETNPEDVVFMFPDHSINYGLVLVHELYKYSEYGDNNNFVLHDDNDETVRPPVIKFHQTSCGVISQSEASDGFNISAQVEHQADVSIGMDDGASQGANDSLGGAPHLVEDEPVVVEPHQTLCGGSPGHI